MKCSKRTRICLIGALVALSLAGCGGKGNSDGDEVEILEEAKTMPDEVALYYSSVAQYLGDVEYHFQQYQIDHSPEMLVTVVEEANALAFEFEDYQLSQENIATCRKLKLKTDSTKAAILSALEQDVRNVRKPLVALDDYLLTEISELPLFLQKGTMIHINFECQGTLTVKLFNADSRSLVKTYAGKKSVADSIAITNSAIYVIELTPKGNTYIDMTVDQSHVALEQLTTTRTVETETVEATASDFRVTKVNGIQMQPVFEEPRKITLRSQGKAFFSGSSRSVVTIAIPKGAVDLLYSLRISTNEGDRSSDGQFCNDMSESYRKVKFLGLPIYESQGSKTSLIRELLNDNVPPREEEAYCNMYVFTSQDQAKKFQDGTPAAELKYNVDLSTFGTQSCNGRIPVKGESTLYLGFENERFRYSNYLWLEVISSVPHTEYYHNKYTLAE